MNHQNPDDPLRPGMVNSKAGEEAVAPLPAAAESIAGEAPQDKPLTPEEQMALYEKDLKENDWGHQPC